MAETSRRNFLKSLLALPAVVAVTGIRYEPEPPIIDEEYTSGWGTAMADVLESRQHEMTNWVNDSLTTWRVIESEYVPDDVIYNISPSQTPFLVLKQHPDKAFSEVVGAIKKLKVSGFSGK